jgi:hypothetical protein
MELYVLGKTFDCFYGKERFVLPETVGTNNKEPVSREFCFEPMATIMYVATRHEDA